MEASRIIVCGVTSTDSPSSHNTSFGQTYCFG